MQVAIFLFSSLAVLGSIVATILMYYHRQIPAVWIIFLTIVSLTLAFYLERHQQLKMKEARSENVKFEKENNLFSEDNIQGIVNSLAYRIKKGTPTGTIRLSMT
jgi:hypothetical protein